MLFLLMKENVLQSHFLNDENDEIIDNKKLMKYKFS